jgi:hypothetical protein
MRKGNKCEVQVLSRNSFTYDILTFKLSRDLEFVPVGLHRNGILTVLNDAGFAKRKVGNSLIYVQLKDGILREVQPHDMREHMLRYIDTYLAGMFFKHNRTSYAVPYSVIREIFLRGSCSLLNKSWLEHLKFCDVPVLRDEENKIYFPFKNCLVVAKNNNTYDTLDWKNVSGLCIWESQLINREFNFTIDISSGHFYKFLRNVTNWDEKRWNSLRSAIGYLLHFYYCEAEGQAVIFYDEASSDIRTPMGGTGKGVIMSAIKTLRSVAKIDGKHFNPDNRFCWEKIDSSTQVVWLDDVKPNFDFSVLHSNLTDGWTVEAKHRSQIQIPPSESPKTAISSNSPIENSGSTNKRRQFIIELSDFYSKFIKNGTEQPIKDYHGCLFFSGDWDSDEWNRFYSLMIGCACEYLRHGLVYSPPINLERNLLKKNTDEDFVTWSEHQKFVTGIKYETAILFKNYIESIGNTTHFGQRKFTSYLQAFAKYKNWEFQRIQSNGRTYFLFGNSI